VQTNWDCLLDAQRFCKNNSGSNFESSHSVKTVTRVEFSQRNSIRVRVIKNRDSSRVTLSLTTGHQQRNLRDINGKLDIIPPLSGTICMLFLSVFMVWYGLFMPLHESNHEITRMQQGEMQ